MQSLTPAPAADGASLSISRSGRLLFERTYGATTLETVVPIASATKWLSGAVIMSLVDDGSLDLDAPLSTYLPEFVGLSGTTTVRQLFSHTSGMEGRSRLLAINSITLEECVRQIAAIPLRATPGTDFFYGGVSMQVAGRVAEVVSGLPWETLFQQRIAVPLGMTDTDYQGLNAPTTNPRIAGGAQSSLRDYANFVEMIENRGWFRGTRVLTVRSVETMLSDQTGGVPVTYAPPTAPGFLGYGIGCWVERAAADGSTLEATSPGAFGFTGFVDRERGTHGVFLTDSSNAAVDPTVDQIRAEVRRQLRFLGTECYGRSAPACNGPLYLRATTAPTLGNSAFAFECTSAPATTLGVAFLSLSAAIPATTFLGVDFHVALGPAALGLTVVSDEQGRFELAAPLDTVARGARAFAQFVAVPTAGCSADGLLATSAGLSVTVR